MMTQFKDRVEAGRILAQRLGDYADRKDGIVLGLPRGGIPVAFEIASALHLPLDVWLVRKLGFPGYSELAMGAIASGGIRVLNEQMLREYPIPMHVIDQVTQKELQELNRREEHYRGHRPRPRIEDQTVILVDDGIATGATLRAGIAALRKEQPKSIVVAVPVAPSSTCRQLVSEVDQLVVLITPEPMHSISLWYQTFPQVSDVEVCQLLDRAQQLGSDPVRSTTGSAA
jgi:putative phosphoribosyl transferase